MEETRADHGTYTNPSAETWPIWKRLPFRFLLCYLWLYCLDVISDVASAAVWLASGMKASPAYLMTALWKHVVPWVGVHLLHLGSVPVIVNGSGDTLYDWLRVLCELVLALVLACVWSGMEPARRKEIPLYRWLFVMVRTLLAVEMFIYGLDKVFPMQFGELTLARLMQPMASSNGMSVLWNSMAASTGYTMFAGSVEVLAGVLLLIPSTLTLGALLSVAAMTNVFVLNLAYDIPVKRYSGHLLLFAVFLVAPSLRRLSSVFLFNREVPAETRWELSKKRWVNRAAVWVPIALCSILCLGLSGLGVSQLMKRRHEAALRSPFYGVWTLTTFDVGDPAKPLLTPKLMKDMKVTKDSDRWRTIIFEGRDAADVELGDGTMDHFKLKEQAGSLLASDSGDPAWKGTLTVQKAPGGTLQMTGTVNGNTIHATLTPKEIVFMKRRFHWVNEW